MSMPWQQQAHHHNKLLQRCNQEIIRCNKEKRRLAQISHNRDKRCYVTLNCGHTNSLPINDHPKRAAWPASKSCFQILRRIWYDTGCWMQTQTQPAWRQQWGTRHRSWVGSCRHAGMHAAHAKACHACMSKIKTVSEHALPLHWSICRKLHSAKHGMTSLSCSNFAPKLESIDQGQKQSKGWIAYLHSVAHQDVLLSSVLPIWSNPTKEIKRLHSLTHTYSTRSVLLKRADSSLPLGSW